MVVVSKITGINDLKSVTSSRSNMGVSGAGKAIFFCRYIEDIKGSLERATKNRFFNTEI